MMPYLPSYEYEQLKETIARLLDVRFRKHNHPFIHPDSVDGLAEQIAEKYDLEIGEARAYIVCLTAKRALVVVREFIAKRPPPPSD